MTRKSVILIADDSPSALLRMEEVLGRDDYELLMVDNGKAALEQAKRTTPDLMLLDVVMPAMDGFEVCKAVRAEPELAEVPVILITSLADRESRLEGFEAGADDFLSKPFDDAELIGRVKTITRLNRYRRLHEERSRFQWVVDQAADGYLQLDGQDRVLYANRAARIFLEAGEEEDISGATFLSLARRRFKFEPEAQWAEWPAVPESGAGGRLTLVRPETARAAALWLEVSVLNQSGIGAGTGAERLLRLRDITDEVSNKRDMWVFHSMVSHKLRTPLSGMLFGLQVLASEPGTFSTDEIREMGSMAYENTQRLSDQIDDILTYLETPALPAEGDGFDLQELGDVLQGIVLEVDCAPPRVEGLEGLEESRVALTRSGLELVLWEVLENAVKFHPRNEPQIDITVEPWGDGMIKLAVADNGVHLSPGQLSRALTPYYQAEKSPTFEVAGMGLGLARAASLVWNVGGGCRINNRTDAEGVVVELLLPLSDANKG